MHLALHRLLTSPKFMTMLGLEIGHQIVINHLRLNKPCSVINIWWSIPVLLMDLDHRGLIPGLNQSKEPGQEVKGNEFYNTKQQYLLNLNKKLNKVYI